MEEPMEVAPGIHMIGGTVGGRPLQLYLLRGDQRVVLIDTGCAPDPERLIFPYLRGLGLAPGDIDLVVNTHADLDHCGGNAAVKRANPAALLACGAADRVLIEDPAVMWACRYHRYAAHGIAYDDAGERWTMEMLGDPQPVDLTWEGGETLRLGRDWAMEVHRTPGHTAGHLALYDPVGRIAVIGDAVHGAVYRDIEGHPALCPTYVHVDTYLGTIRYLRQLGAETLFSAHWPAKRGDEVAAFLDESEQFVATADRALAAALRAHPEGLTLRALIAIVGPQLGDWPRAVDQELVFALAGHMERMMSLGSVAIEGDANPVSYRCTR